MQVKSSLHMRRSFQDDFPPHLFDHKEHDDKQDADLEPKDLFQSDSHISCQSPDEEIHQTQKDDAGSETSSSRRKFAKRG